MKKKKPEKPLTDDNGEVRELTADDLADMRPFREEFPGLYNSWKRGRGRPPAANPKRGVYVRLDPDVIDWLKSAGKGYQTRINAILRQAMDK